MRFRGALLGPVLALALPGLSHGATCAPHAAGGDWPMYGRTLANDRSQPAEHHLTPARVSHLYRAWSFSTGHASGVLTGNLPDFNATPIEVGGCVYVGSGATNAPNVFALNADTGALVWKATLDAGDGGLGGAIPGSLSYDGGKLYALVNAPGDGKAQGPYVAALDAGTGAVLWRSKPVVTTAGDYTNASPAVADGVVVAGFSATEGDPYGHGGFGLVDAQTGDVLATTFTVPPSQWGTPQAPGYAGGGIWTTPAADPGAGYAYMGSGNPYSKKTQYPTTDAILKVDIDRSRPTFGQIVGYYAGNIEQYTELIKKLSAPTCALLPDDPLRGLPSADPRIQEAQGLIGNSIGCVQLDLDFGSAANLFHQNGHLVVGDLQKSGIYHAVYADTMKRAWWSVMDLSCEVCNGASTAYDAAAHRIYGDVSPGSLLAAISANGGGLRWYSPVLDLFHYQSVSVAGGVIYTMDGLGFLDAFRASDGLPLLRRALLLDAGPDAIPPAGYDSAGVAIARHTVYAEAGNHVVAYRAR